MAALAAALAAPVLPERTRADPAARPPAPQREACAARDPLRRPFYGDLHVHTGLSFDALGQGIRVRPRDAYRFALGEPLELPPYGEGAPRIRLRRPLDFAAVTDHAELLGETRICQEAGLPGHDSLVCRLVRRLPGLGYVLVNGTVLSRQPPERLGFCGSGGGRCLEAARGPWREIREAAEEFYDRSAACRFTTFVAYEWSSMPDGRNLHRNVIFRSEAVPELPTSALETPTPEGLWEALRRGCLEAGTGCDAVAIPHNSNVSGGLMFTLTGPDGSPPSPEQAELRARLERLVEVTQHKGDSECRPTAEDELCSYEKLAYPLLREMVTAREPLPIPPGSYVREGLLAGLAEEAAGRPNPLAFGLIGSTDTHLGAPGQVDEDRHVGHAAGSVTIRFGVPPFPDRPDFNPGGLAGLWAEENSREALFAAMKRREAFGTSGPRIAVRLFGGYAIPDDLCSAPDFAARGYASGVPMGGELPPDPAGRPPRLAVLATRDPGGDGVPTTPLQRIQIVKGAVVDGRPVARVFEVAGDPAGSATVDPETCAPRGPGFDRLCAVFEDPEFDPEVPAFYYARVLENPSCRWNAWVCLRQGVDCARPETVAPGLEPCCDPSTPRTVQERAWSSPIWVHPNRGGRP